ncbi:uncharacterized protein LOC117639850, partial [Thrips palmi]|uniref:Uncharacterized protein LOC117639850 n=1 Tax=Thrips palmi TaxID=161013 RepID=A0A6P8XX73_THRPL
DEDEDEEMKKELVNYLIKFQKKHKELHVDHSSDETDPDGFARWKNRADVARDDGDVEAGGDLDVDVDAALEPPSRTTLQEAATLAKELGVA